MSRTAFRLDSTPAELVSAERFREALGVSESGFRYMIARGRISEPIMIRGRSYWRPETVEFYVAQRQRRLATNRAGEPR